jgi:hypothetical protein
MDRKLIYYQGFKELLSNKKTFDEIIGSSRLHNLCLTDSMAKKGITI